MQERPYCPVAVVIERQKQPNAWEDFERDRAARQKAADLGAKHRHSLGYGEHL